MKTIKLSGIMLDLDKINTVNFDDSMNLGLAYMMHYEENSKVNKINVTYWEKEIIENYFSKNSILNDKSLITKNYYKFIINTYYEQNKEYNKNLSALLNVEIIEDKNKEIFFKLNFSDPKDDKNLNKDNVLKMIKYTDIL